MGYTRKNKITKKAVIDTYKVKNYRTLPTSNLYAFCIERSNMLLNNTSLVGMIIPISAFSNDSMKELQELFKTEIGEMYLSSFHQRPAQLFDGVLQRLSIFIARKRKIESKLSFYTSQIFRWFSDTRQNLFELISYVETLQNMQSHFVKLGNQFECSIFNKYSKHKKIQNYIGNNGSDNNRIFYRTAGGGYWTTFLNAEFDSFSVSNKSAAINETISAKFISAALNSSLFWWYYSINYDLFNFKDYMIFGFQVNLPNQHVLQQLNILSVDMERCLRKNAVFYEINSQTAGKNQTVTYQKAKSKDIMDSIDTILAEHYSFSEEELDFIINYDIKYRMGEDD